MPSDLVAEVVAWRHAFHAEPELEFDLPRTAARVAGLLRSFGLEVHEGIGRSGVVGVLERGAGGAVALRADMDALPITEANGFAHASRRAGRMHACGHDGHMAMLLGAARALSRADDIAGRVVFVFQPNEEFGQGAAAMIRDGLFERFAVPQIYGLHNMPGLPLGHVETRVGPMTASEALFEIEISGRGGHAALPHMGADAITVGAEMVGALQTIVSRKLDPAQNGVVSVTGFETDGRRNVLPGRAVLSGDARALTPATNGAIEAAMRRIAGGIAAAHGVEARVSYDTIFPPVINAAGPVDIAARAALHAGLHVDAAGAPKMFSEDFAHFAARVPGAFLLLGNGTQGAHARPLHSADYDFNDAALGPGVALWCAIARMALAA